MKETFQEKATRIALSKGLDLGIAHIKKDPQKGILDVVDLLEKYMNPASSEANSGKSAYDGIRKTFSDPDSKWVEYATDIVNDIDDNVIKHFIMNTGYNAGYKGNNLRMKLQKQEGCNIPWTILFDPTSACNMHCKGCWAAEYGYKNNLSYEEMCSIVEQGNELGAYFFLMTGGEPLMRKDDIIKLADKFNDSEFHIYTNGTLIDDAFCEEVRRVGNISFALSIEGNEEANDSRRGDGSYKKIIHALDLMKKHKLLYGVSICYTSVNYKAVTDDAFIQLLVDHGCKLAWYFHYMPVGNEADKDLLLSPEQREYTLKKIREIRSMQYSKNLFTIDFQNDGVYIGGCIAGGKNYFHINSNGDMEPCVFIHYSDSNIRKNTILEGLKNPLFMSYHKAQPFNKNLLQPCPMLENPEKVVEMVNSTNSPSTDFVSPESAEHLTAKTVEYAKAWKPSADRLWAEDKHNKDAKPEDIVR